LAIEEKLRLNQPRQTAPVKVRIDWTAYIAQVPDQLPGETHPRERRDEPGRISMP
jgi:hypothetical protein